MPVFVIPKAPWSHGISDASRRVASEIDRFDLSNRRRLAAHSVAYDWSYEFLHTNR